MPTESELRDQLSGVAPRSTRGIDVDAVVRRAKARRTPRQVIVGSASVLAIAGFTVLGVSVAPSLLGPHSTMSDSLTAQMPESAQNNLKETSGGDQAQNSAVDPDISDSGVDQCGSAPSSVPPNSLGLVLTADFPATAPANGEPVSGTVTLTNTGASHVEGTTTAAPSISLSRDSVTVWHSNGAMISLAVMVSLDPGQSITYPASFTPVACSPEGESVDSFPGSPPPLGPGSVTVKATIFFIPDAPAGEERVLVSGPVATISLQ